MILILLYLFLYFAVGLVIGRVYYTLEMKKWHGKAKHLYKTRAEISKLKELERLKQEKQREELKKERKEAIDRCEAEYSRAKKDLLYLQQAEARLHQDKNSKLDDGYLKTLNSIQSDICRQKCVVETTERNLDRAYNKKHDYRDHHLIEYGFGDSGPTETYEGKRAVVEKRTGNNARTILFVWPVIVTVIAIRLSLTYTYKGINKFIGQGAPEKYVSDQEHILQAKINALTEKDPELAKLYGDLVKHLED